MFNTYVDLIDVGQKDTFLCVFCFIQWILPVFSLHQTEAGERERGEKKKEREGSGKEGEKKEKRVEEGRKEKYLEE